MEQTPMNKKRPLTSYEVPVTFQMRGTIHVKARSPQSLLKKLNNPDFVYNLELPDEWDYVDDSLEIDFNDLKYYLKRKCPNKKGCK